MIGSAAGADRSPNIVLIVADDLGWGDVGFNGRSEWATPNLDRLAAGGTILSRFYAASPVCAPSRAALLTGKATIHCGVGRNEEDLPAGETTIAEALRAHGYATAMFGKWHHGRPRRPAGSYVHPLDQGFDEFFGFTDAIHAWEKFPTVVWDGRSRVPASGYADDRFADRAVEFVAGHRDRPFFLYLAFTAPHFTIEAPGDELARHRGRFPEADPARPLNAAYAAMITRLDRNVGRVLKAIDEAGLAGETLVVFTSDNGATFEAGNQGASLALDSNRPLRGQKRTLWEGGIRVPAVVRWPGRIPAGRVAREPAQMIDLMPTLLAAAGAAPDPAWRVDGLDLLAAWSGRSAPHVRTLFWEWRGEGSDQLAAMRGDLKLIINRRGTPELYDVAGDPAERRDVAAAHPDLVERLQEELEAWLATEVTDERGADAQHISTSVREPIR
jgi:arylsulfatase A-like enzyme